MLREPELQCLSVWKLTGAFSLSPVNQPDSSVSRVPFLCCVDSDNAATQWQFIDTAVTASLFPTISNTFSCRFFCVHGFMFCFCSLLMPLILKLRVSADTQGAEHELHNVVLIV